jgi:hypothetical protein
VINEVDDLLGRDRGGDQLAGRRIVIEPLEPFREPVRDRRAGARGEIFRLLEVLHRQNAGDDRNMDSGSAGAVEITEIKAVFEKELRHRAAGAGIDLGFEHIDVGLHRRAVRMLFRIGRDRHFDIGNPLDAGDEIGAVAIAAGMRRIAFADTAGRIAAQRHDVAHACLCIGFDDRVDIAARRGDAG